MPQYTSKLRLEKVGTTTPDINMSVQQWRTGINGLNNSNMDKIDDFATTTDDRVATSETDIINLKANKYDDITADLPNGTVTFKANSAVKKTIQVARIDQIKLDSVVKSGIDFVSKTIPSTPNQEYGIKVDLDTNTIARLGDATGKTLNDFYEFFPWAGMRREIIEGQYMVRIPLFYYKRVATKKEAIPQSADGNEIGEQLIIWEDWISPIPKDGYFIHPCFIRNGKILDEIWFSAFEGSVYDSTNKAYLLADEQTANSTTDLLCSIPNAKPCSGKTQNLTIENARKLANNRSKDSNFEWMQQDFTMVSAIQMLIAISTGSYDCQATVGQGAVNIADTPNTDNNSLITGSTLSMGVRCGSAGENGKSSVNFFGIENFWGNIWKFVDGINIEASTKNQGWISNDDLTVNTSVNKDNLGFTICKSNGYMSKMGWDKNIDFAFMPTECKSGKIISKDNFYQNNAYSGYLIARLGGRWTHGSSAGCFYWHVATASSARVRDFGARLACIKK